MHSNRRPVAAKLNNASEAKDDYGGFGDFDDLPSVKSRDLMSQ